MKAFAALLNRLAGDLEPPDVWAEPRPALRDEWAYATSADWTGEDGVPRRAGQTYAVVVMPIRFLLGYLDWVIARPTRAAFGAFLFFTVIVPLFAWIWIF